MFRAGEQAFYYPAPMTICEPVPRDALFTAPPSVILEVLNPTSRRIDEVQKLRDHLTLPTLQTYVLVETDSLFLTHHRKEGAAFRREIISATDAILDRAEVQTILPLGRFYQTVKPKEENE